VWIVQTESELDRDCFLREKEIESEPCRSANSLLAVIGAKDSSGGVSERAHKSRCRMIALTRPFADEEVRYAFSDALCEYTKPLRSHWW